MADHLRLGVNIDHVATLRNARGGALPDPVRAAVVAEQAGADGITAHLREDRRHIRDADVGAIMAAISIPLNFEMAATPEMQAIALSHRPHAACIVPERREERTTEGGLEVAGVQNWLADYIAPLRDDGIRVSLFIAADPVQIAAAHRIGAPVIELHTGASLRPPCRQRACRTRRRIGPADRRCETGRRSGSRGAYGPWPVL